MKQFIALSLALLAGQLVQGQEKKTEWATIKIPQIKCWECKERLEQYLAREKGPNDDAGILQWQVNQSAGNLRIRFIPTRISLDFIKTAINNAGFDADSTRATEDSYKMLPPVCKRPEEGGGPQKGKPCKLPPQ